jgi:hypothetical protein
MSDVFTALWGPLLGSLSGVIDWEFAMLAFFLANLGLSTFLVFWTGGSHRSPFQSLYFLMPTLAIFLREGAGRVWLYTVLVVTSYSVCMVAPDRVLARRSRDHEPPLWASWLVTIASFLIAVVVGLATRLP